MLVSVLSVLPFWIFWPVASAVGPAGASWAATLKVVSRIPSRQAKLAETTVLAAATKAALKAELEARETPLIPITAERCIRQPPSAAAGQAAALSLTGAIVPPANFKASPSHHVLQFRYIVARRTLLVCSPSSAPL